jgi:hypothetical protein
MWLLEEFGNRFFSFVAAIGWLVTGAMSFAGRRNTCRSKFCSLLSRDLPSAFWCSFVLAASCFMVILTVATKPGH